MNHTRIGIPLIAFAVLLVSHSQLAICQNENAAKQIPTPSVRVTEEGQHVIFDAYTWQYRELAKVLPLDQPWPADDKIAPVFKQYALDKPPVPTYIPSPVEILPDVYLLASEIDSSHAYLIDCGKDGVAIIDPGFTSGVDRLLRNVEQLGFSKKSIRWVLNTHAHYDHAMADAYFSQLGAKIMIGEADADAVEKATQVTANFLAPELVRDYPKSKVDWRLSDGEQLQLGNKQILVLHTPGHTDGSSCFLLQVNGKNVLFSGDTLLYDYRIAWQGPYADNRAYVASLAKLNNFKLNLSPQFRFDVILPGHGALVLDRGYMDIEKGLRAVQIDLLEGSPIDATPFADEYYRKLMFGRPADSAKANNN